MQTTAPDREDCQVETIHLYPQADDAGLRDVFDLWRDLGGSD